MSFVKFTSRNQKDLSSPVNSQGVALLATLLGAFVRCFYVFMSDFPLNDGGMFYTMVQDLQKNHFLLPAVTTYNLANIPYAYPPLPFYLAAFLNSWFKIDLIQILRFLPLIFSIATIPAFYWLAKQVLKNETQVGAATFIFALFSPVFTWQIMGGGLTRSPAFFFAVLSLAAYFKWAKSRHWKDLVLVIVFTSLTTLCHLEMLLLLCISYIVIFFFLQRSWKQLGQLALAALVTIVLISPWWGTVIFQHGISPFIQAMKVGRVSFLTTLSNILVLQPSQNINDIVFTLLGLAGSLLLISQGDWMLFVWWAAFVILDPRSTERSVTLPITLIAGIMLEQIIVWMKGHLPDFKMKKNPVQEVGNPLQKNSVKLLIIVAIFFSFFTDLVVKYTSETLLNSLNFENRQAMDWVKANTSEDSDFLVIDYPSGWHVDMVGEWFPTLTERKSLLTGQGQEWLPMKAQAKTIKDLSEVSNCRMEGLSCLEDWLGKKDTPVDYFYFTSNSQSTVSFEKYTSVLEAQMASSPDYALSYSNKDVRIYTLSQK